MTRTGTLAALDIGTTKIGCFIARTGDDGRISIAGIGHHAAKGMRAGSVVDMDAVAASVAAAVNAAEQMAGEQVDALIVNVSCGYPSSRTIGIEFSIDGHEIGEVDMRRALDQGRRYQVDEDRALIHSIPVGYVIDGHPGIRDPRGMFADRLGVEIHLVTTAAGALRNLVACVDRCHLDTAAHVVSSYASGLACLVEDEMEMGVTVIDMGGGTTSLAVFFEGEVVFTDLVPVGGQHVTSDIAHGLSTPMIHAERMKTLYGSAIASAADEHEVIDVPRIGEGDQGEPNHVPRSLLTGIIQPRLEEIFELVRSRLEMSGFGKVAGRRVVLTGGASQLSGVRDLAALVLDKQVRLGRPVSVDGLADMARGPAFATCAGLLVYGVEKSFAPTAWPGFNADDQAAGLFGRFGQWFRVHF